MAIEKFRFVSPGVQVNEIDESIIPTAQPAIGPVIIGNTAKGPAMEPISVSSVAEFERIFGPSSNGNTNSVDVWRSGVPTSPTLATYAAKAFLANASPVTVIRLAGVPLGEADDSSSDASKAGWKVDHVYELYAVSASVDLADQSASLAAVIYSDTEIELDNETAGLAPAVGGSGSLTINSVPIEFSLNTSKENFIRNVLNTNPSKHNNSSYGYFLGESFENSYKKKLPVITHFKLYDSGSSDQTFLNTVGATPARSGFVVSELAGETYTDLFYFESLENGSSPSKEIKISIENVKPTKNANVTKYGTFDVVVRPLFESTTKSVLERFSGLTLDPNSENYIVKRIGDSSRSWDPDNLRYSENGTYGNKSSYIRVVMSNEDISPSSLPCGFRKAVAPSTDKETLMVDGVVNADIEFLTHVSASSIKSNRFGMVANAVKNSDLVDILRYKGQRDYSSGKLFHAQYIKKDTDNNVYLYEQDVLNADANLLLSGTIVGFDMPMYDGFDAKNILVSEPFVNNFILSNGTSLTNPAHRAIKQALNMVAQPETIDMNLLCVPGLQNKDLTTDMVELCRTRGDCMAIIDIEGDYLYPHDREDGTEYKPNNVLSVVNTLKERSIDNSYGAAYFPAVFVPSEGIYMPASIAALGALGGTEGRSALWFAPAGFNRGGLTQLTSGIGVSKTAIHLISSDRDELYDNNINPIATFPNEGVVIFGQKTLQVTPSALDRVNVRRLVNYIKKYISRAATRVLFEPNVEATWNSFKSVVEPFLQNIKSNYGLDDAKVVLDPSTTTADLIDRNVMYCKIYLKPTRAIEFIGIDFVVTNSGASFTE